MGCTGRDLIKEVHKKLLAEEHCNHKVGRRCGHDISRVRNTICLGNEAQEDNEVSREHSCKYLSVRCKEANLFQSLDK